MSNKRKLSFLGFAPQGQGEDEVKLDDEMERVVWSEGTPPPRLLVSGEPVRDAHAPLPQQPPAYNDHITQDNNAGSPDRSFATATQTGSGGESPREDDRHVQFHGDDSRSGLLDDSDERREERNA